MKFCKANAAAVEPGSLPPRGAWIEINTIAAYLCQYLSLPPRGAWIEMELKVFGEGRCEVAPPTGSVD